jgi:hypothetical protein
MTRPSALCYAAALLLLASAASAVCPATPAWNYAPGAIVTGDVAVIIKKYCQGAHAYYMPPADCNACLVAPSTELCYLSSDTGCSNDAVTCPSCSDNAPPPPPLPSPPPAAPTPTAAGLASASPLLAALLAVLSLIAALM